MSDQHQTETAQTEGRYGALRQAFQTELANVGGDPSGIFTLKSCVADMLGAIGVAAQKLADSTAQRRTG